MSTAKLQRTLKLCMGSDLLLTEQVSHFGCGRQPRLAQHLAEAPNK